MTRNLLPNPEEHTNKNLSENSPQWWGNPHRNHMAYGEVKPINTCLSLGFHMHRGT